MKVKLLTSTPNAKELIYTAARQCYSKGFVGDTWGDEIADDKMNKLITHLKTSGHTSVLEHVSFTFAIDGISRALTHQLVRHRIASYSQQSQRYVNLNLEMNIDNYIVPPKIKENNKAYFAYVDALTNIQKTYNNLIEVGISPEDARFVLPNASITRIVMTMNCVALLHFFDLRCCNLAQWEIRDLANTLLSICKDKLPIIFKNAGSKCIALGYCPESKQRSCCKYPLKSDVVFNERGYTRTKGE